MEAIKALLKGPTVGCSGVSTSNILITSPVFKLLKLNFKNFRKVLGSIYKWDWPGPGLACFPSAYVGVVLNIYEY